MIKKPQTKKTKAQRQIKRPTGIKQHKGQTERFRTALEPILDKLDFEVEQVIDACLEQPSLFAKVCDIRREVNLEYLRAKGQLDCIEADVSQHLRIVAHSSGEKSTENSINEQVRSDDAVMSKTLEKQELESLDEYMKLLVDAFRMRRDCLRIISDLAGLGIGADAAKLAAAESMANVRRELERRRGR